MEAQLVEHAYHRCGRWMVIRDIPALVCDLCGETTLPEASVVRVEAIANGGDTPRDSLWVPVFNFVADAQVVPPVQSTALSNSQQLVGKPLTETQWFSGQLTTAVVEPTKIEPTVAA